MSGGPSNDDYNPRQTTSVKPKRGRGGDGGSSGGDADPCDIDKKTILNSPNPAVLRTLRVGEILDVVVATSPRRILQAMTGSNVAGSITFPEMGQVINCIEKEGETFKAEVVSINGGQCHVRVYRV